jgi:ribosome biogenesis GTPase
MYLGQETPHYEVLSLSLANEGEADRQLLMQHLQGKATLVLGPSGSGKSTLINLLVPGARAATNEISQALNSGKHTTTTTSWYWMDEERTTALIDSPSCPAACPTSAPMHRNASSTTAPTCTSRAAPSCPAWKTRKAAWMPTMTSAPTGTTSTLSCSMN